MKPSSVIACWIHVAALGLSHGAMAAASDAGLPPVLTMEPVQVAAHPFGQWGIGLNLHYRTMELATGGPPKSVYIAWVQADSQAEREGIEVGDEVILINGQPVDSLSRITLQHLLYDSSSNDRIVLHLVHRLSDRPFRVDLVLPPNRPAAFAPVFWGVRITAADGTTFHLRHGPALQRRSAEIVWERRVLTIAENLDGSVALVDGRRKRLLPRGFVLALQPGGGYDLSGWSNIPSR